MVSQNGEYVDFYIEKLGKDILGRDNIYLRTGGLFGVSQAWDVSWLVVGNTLINKVEILVSNEKIQILECDMIRFMS